MKTILIVDDEYDIVGALKLSFEMDGYTVRAAYDGREGLERLKELPVPDLVISDLMMPVMSGYVFISLLKADPKYRAIPVILLSATNLDRSKLREGDWNLFFTKPFELDVLSDAVATLLKERK